MVPIRIVHFDDNPGFLETFRTVFNSAVASVRSVADGEEAREIVQQGECDVLVVDRSGFAFAKEMLEAKTRFDAVVVLSGAPELADFEADLLLQKLGDNNFEQIFQLLNNLVRRRWSTPTVGGKVDSLADEMVANPGKLLILSGTPETVVFRASSLTEAESFIRGQLPTRKSYRIFQCPPQRRMTLAEMEGE